MIVVGLAPILFPYIQAQCYGCGQNTTALKQALFEKQTMLLKQKDEQLSQDSQIIALLIGVSISLACVTGIVIWALFMKIRRTKT